MAITLQQSSARPGKTRWLAKQPLQRKILLAIGLLSGLFLTANFVVRHSLRGRAEALRSSTAGRYDMTDRQTWQKYVLDDLTRETAEKAAGLARASQNQPEP